MTLFFCLDDNQGMLFNNRRQSRDRAVLRDMAAQLTGPLMIDPMSEKMMLRHQIPYLPAPEAPEEIDPSAQYFVEEARPEDLLKLADRVVLYRWNRVYPADRYFEAALPEEGFSLAEVREFPGHSHETITREVYVR